MLRYFLNKENTNIVVLIIPRNLSPEKKFQFLVVLFLQVAFEHTQQIIQLLGPLILFLTLWLQKQIFHYKKML